PTPPAGPHSPARTRQTPRQRLYGALRMVCARRRLRSACVRVACSPSTSVRSARSLRSWAALSPCCLRTAELERSGEEFGRLGELGYSLEQSDQVERLGDPVLDAEGSE